jgi:hypothetical protein
MTRVRYNAERRGTNRVVYIPHCKEVAVHSLFHLYINGGQHFTRPTILQHCAGREWPGAHCALTSIPLCNHLLCLHRSDPVILILAQLLSFPFLQQLTFDLQPYNRNTKISITQHNRHISDPILPSAMNMDPAGTYKYHDSDWDHVKTFLSACEPVLDLPFGTGEVEWNAFHVEYNNIMDRGIDLRKFICSATHERHFESPLFAILFDPLVPTRPPITFSRAPETPGTAQTPARGIVDFKARRFVSLCEEINIEFIVNGRFVKTDAYRRLHRMVATLHRERINVLDFLSSEETDDLLNGCAFFRLVVHVFTGFASHVIVDWSAWEDAIHALGRPQGFEHAGSRLQMPPYPPNDYGLPFCQDDLLQSMADAELDIDLLAYGHLGAVESFDVLHRRMHHLKAKNVKFFDFMAGYKFQQDEQGFLIFNYIRHSFDLDTDEFLCNLFMAHVVSDGNGVEFLNDLHAPPPPSVLTQEQAVAFVDALQQADVANIPQDSMRCPHCWSNFDEVEEGMNNLPVHLPCDSCHMLGRDCLIAILTGTGTLCPICRVDIVALGPQAPGTSS